jgi:hypothetical protein
MKIEKKTVATLMMTILMLSMLSFVAFAGPTGYWFTVDTGSVGTDGEAGVTTTKSHAGTHSARLYIPGDSDVNDGAKVRFPYTGTLESLVEFSYWTLVTGTDGGLHPYGSINIDANIDGNYDGNADYVIVQWEVSGYAPEGADIWVKTTFDDTTRIHVVDATSGAELPGFGQTDAKTLGQLKEETGWTYYHIVQVKLAVGMWSLPYALEGFVDDVQVNEITYDFEPISVGLTAEVTEYIPPTIISISVTPTSIDFGTITQGEPSPDFEVSVASASTVDVEVSASVIEVGTFYTDNLNLNDGPVSAWTTIIAEGGAPVSVELVLYVPIGATLGTHEGTLVFWAEQTP